MSQSRRPMGVVRGSLCPLRTASQASATPNALVATLIRLGWNRVRRRPPMPAQLVHPFRSFHSDQANRQRGQWRGVASRISGVAPETRNPHFEIHLVVERLKVFVREGPVIRDAIERFHPKIGWHETLPMGRIKD